MGLPILLHIAFGATHNDCAALQKSTPVADLPMRQVDSCTQDAMALHVLCNDLRNPIA